MCSIRKLAAGLHGCAGKRSPSRSDLEGSAYTLYESETEESTEEYYKLSSFEDVSCTAWTSKAEVNPRTCLEDSETA
jgi:hypothetical protein